MSYGDAQISSATGKSYYTRPYTFIDVTAFTAFKSSFAWMGTLNNLSVYGGGLPSHINGDSTITLRVTISQFGLGGVLMEVWRGLAHTAGQEFIFFNIQAFGVNGSHPWAVFGWVACQRIRY